MNMLFIFRVGLGAIVAVFMFIGLWHLTNFCLMGLLDESRVFVSGVLSFFAVAITVLQPVDHKD